MFLSWLTAVFEVFQSKKQQKFNETLNIEESNGQKSFSEELQTVERFWLKKNLFF